MLLFFSSDYNSLFKKDVLNALSMPVGHCIHFRYWESIIAPAVLNNLSSLNGREGIIIYVKGNDSNLPEDQRQVSFFPIRKVEVRKCRRDQQTELIHFSLELKEFVSTSASIDLPPQSDIPPYIFINEGTIHNNPITYWYTKIDDLVVFDPKFKNSLFFHVNLKYCELGFSQNLEVPFDDEEEATFFKLSEGKSYVLDLSILISDPDMKELEKYECSLEYDQKDILISNPSSIIIGAQRDNRRYKLITKSIESVRSFDYLKVIAFKRKTANDIEVFYESIVRFKIGKSVWNAIAFIGLMFLNVVGTAVFTYAIAEKQVWLMLVGLIPVIVSALCQYYYYNKS